MTLEQCWHRVPGGTAVAGIGMARALDRSPRADPVGVAARHTRPAPRDWSPPIRVEHVPLPRLALYESWHRWRRPRVEKTTGPVDVVHATTFAIPPRSATLVVTVHDLAFVHEPGHFTKRGLSFFRRGMELTIQEADVIHCPSQATAKDCVANGFDRDRIRVIPFGIDPLRPDDASLDAALERHGITRPYVLWTGTIEPRKNLRGLLEAWRLADRDAEVLVLVGPEGWREDLQPALEAARNVRTLGFVDRSTLGLLYSGAAAFCWPSLREGFGFPVLEAMAQGCPVVTSRGTSTEEITGDAGELVDPGDPHDIARALTRVLDDRARAESLSARGRERAATFTWERTAELLCDAYTAGSRAAA
ncbi:MAG: glycosyltransferase family 4 protein [Actinobacteria bacterium]|nr:glycosyltransferase family 4 protein [Actinomycetota bacterium]